MDRAERNKLMEQAELEEMRNPEEALRRRDFLRRSAYAAGLATAGVLLPAEVLLKEAARNTAMASGMPSASTMPIDHFVVLMMENRSFDHYFGWLPGADGVQSRTYPDPDNGGTLSTHHASTMGDARWQGCGHPDPDHSWDGGRDQLGSSLSNPSVEPDGFLQGVNDEFALTYYNEDDLGFIHAAGKEFTVYDRFHGSLMASTWPNRYYMWSATSGGLKNNDPPVATGGNQWPTIFDRADAKRSSTIPPGLKPTATYYQSDLPFSAVWGPRAVPWTKNVNDYYAACAAGTLPSISFVDPPFRDGGGGDGLSADEHPLGDVRLGQAFMSDVVNAFVESPCWERGALFIVYDEWGGFFDHVRPPSVPDIRQNTSNINEDFGLMGYRIPATCISPYAFRGGISHQLSGFESILKLISYRFALTSLTTRDDQTANIGLTMNWDAPDLTRPDLPDYNHIASQPCSTGGGPAEDSPEQTHTSDLAALEDLADRYGFATGTGKAEEIFRSPDGVKKAFAR